MDGEHPLFPLEYRDVVAVVSKVRREEFCGPEAAERMQDLTWVGPRACRHEAVIEQTMRVSPVLPVRFATLFSSRESLEEVLKRHHRPICRFLERVTGKEEWAVKGMLDRKQAKEAIFSAILTRQKQPLSALSQGIRYFEKQRLSARVEKELSRWLRETCREVIADLRRVAVAFRRRPLLSLGGNPAEQAMVLNCAFLVPRTGLREFQRQVHKINAAHAPQGLLFQSSGPWPPYSFCSSRWIMPG